jgi:hypothetical protein
MEEAEELLKKEDMGKYVSALFKAEEAFAKELAEYASRGRPGYAPPAVKDMLSGSLLKKLPLKYRLLLKLPWQGAVEMLAGFLKNLGEGSTEDVLMGLAKEYMDNVQK